jgi:four helix bundle protein
MRTDNQVLIDSKSFAIRVIKLYKFLKEEKHVTVLSKQVLRSGTSIGANVRESVNAQSRMDFINKLNIALKEANETEYWLELLHESGFIDEKQFESIYNDCGKLAATLTKIIKTTKTTPEPTINEKT